MLVGNKIDLEAPNSPKRHFVTIFFWLGDAPKNLPVILAPRHVWYASGCRVGSNVPSLCLHTLVMGDGSCKLQGFEHRSQQHSAEAAMVEVSSSHSSTASITAFSHGGCGPASSVDVFFPGLRSEIGCLAFIGP